MAISTLRRKRSRPVRFTGDFANSARKPASSSRARSARLRRLQRGARRELRFAAQLRELVPGADREAVVAAVDAVAHGAAELARDRSLVLDGEIGDAAPRIEPVGRREGRGRADVEAGPAGAAVVGARRHRAAVRAVVRIAPRKSHEPNSRETRLVCLPCQPSPAAIASGFSISGGGIDEHLHVAAGVARSASAPPP